MDEWQVDALRQCVRSLGDSSHLGGYVQEHCHLFAAATRDEQSHDQHMVWQGFAFAVEEQLEDVCQQLGIGGDRAAQTLRLLDREAGGERVQQLKVPPPRLHTRHCCGALCVLC